MMPLFPSWVQSSKYHAVSFFETWIRLSVASPLPNGNGSGSTGGDGQNNVLRVLWRYHLHYKVKTDNTSHVMSH